MDWRSILTYIVVIILVIIGLNYFQVNCDWEKAKPIKGFMDFEQGPTKQTPVGGPKHEFVEETHEKQGEEGKPNGRAPSVPAPAPPIPPGP